MARARLLKPSFFTNSALGMLPMGDRLVFQGLWCVADRDGRLSDDPRRLKVEILPYDKVNMDAVLDRLASAGFILRYESGDARYIQVINFAKHQSPHVREQPSTIPAPGQHRASTGPAPDEPLPRTPLNLKPIPIADPVAVAVADPGPPAEDPVPLLLRHWERAIGTTVTPALADWLDSELGQATPPEWLRDAITETGANGSKAWKYTKAIIDRWKVTGRDAKPNLEGNHGRRTTTAGGGDPQYGLEALSRRANFVGDYSPG